MGLVAGLSTGRLGGLALYIGLNVGLIAYWGPPSTDNVDWRLWNALPRLLADGELYSRDVSVPYVWSPLLAPVMAAVPLVGYGLWLVAHYAVLLLLRGWRLIGMAAISWPLYVDAVSGNTMAFVFVAGALAYRGSRPASLVFLAFCLLIPRPLYLPLAAWLLWKDRRLWVPFGVLFGVHAVAVLGSGYADDWVRAVMLQGQLPPSNFGPARFLGLWWLVVGIPLGVWLTIKGHVGWAGIAVSPYVVAYYYLMPLIGPRRRRTSWRYSTIAGSR